MNDSNHALPIDNVYVGKYYKTPVYTVAEAIQAHRETHHPTQYNRPDDPLIVKIELYMQAEKKTRMVDNFQRIAPMPYTFDHGEERNVMFLARTQEVLQEAQKAGATLTGGVELIKNIQNGSLQLSDYQFVLAHPNILSDLVVLRGLMKKRFPSPKSGTLGVEVTEMVKRFLCGIEYKAVKDEHQPDFGSIETTIGKLNMDAGQLEENLVSLLKDVNSVRPRREGRFITRCKLRCPPSSETLHINPFLYIPEMYEKDVKTQAEDNEESDDEAEQLQKEATAA